MTFPGSETVLIRREDCRKCNGAVWAIYHVTPEREECGWGAVPIGKCGNSQRCGEKLIGLANDDLAIFTEAAAGAA